MRRKIVIIIITFITFTLSIYGQDSDSLTDINERINILEKEIEELNDIIKNEELENRLKLSTETINTYNSLFTIFIAIQAILLALLGIGIPISSYFFVIKPWKKTNKWIKNKFEEFMSNYQKEEMDRAILSLVYEQDDKLKRNAREYIEKNYYYKFSDEQLLNLNSALFSIEDIYLDIKHTVMRILAKRQSKVADLFFAQHFCTYGWDIIKYAFNYFDFMGIERFIKRISKNLIELEIKKFEQTIKEIFHHSADKYFIKFINYETLVSKLSKDKIQFLNELITKNIKYFESKHIKNSDFLIIKYIKKFGLDKNKK